MVRAVPPFLQRTAVLCLAAALLPVAAACGPTAEQLESRQATQSPSATGTPAPQEIPAPIPEPEPEPPAPPPLQVGVSGSQAGMAGQVQAECQWLLRRDTAPFPAADAGACVSAAMVAGQGARQSVTTMASWLPPDTYSMDFRTAPGFSMELRSPDAGLEITIDGDSRILRTGDVAVAANADGTPEEAYAAVLVDAAEITGNPERLRGLLESARPAVVDYEADFNGVPATKLTAVIESTEPGEFTGAVVLMLDDLYRPLLIDYSGTTRGMATSIRAVVTDWGSGSVRR
ncbi:hypothetical protein [Arthrobacter sp.]|uniref:hypothetical protein n=1 Tax=Arthrobacter sp. TaxID=1667 RepID=UPI0028974406|nr:hypothetical protein [Arthrobacter sp.]